MHSIKWIGFAAGRYIHSGRKDKSKPVSILAVLGIGIGVLALTVILGVMNGFQLGFIESILEVSSYHIRIESFPAGGEGDALKQQILAIPQVRSAVEFQEIQGLIQGTRSSQQVSIIRGVPQDALAQDLGMAEKLTFEYGGFDLSSDKASSYNSILLGAELALRIGADVGDEINLLSISGLFPEEAGTAESRYIVKGIFRTGFYEYDMGWGFINIDNAAEISGSSVRPTLGIKISNRWQDDQILSVIKNIPGLESADITSWRDYNRAFFGALRTEKLLMFVLVGLIFIVVGLNIFQSQRKAVLERREDIGLLRAVGASDIEVRLVFAYDGLIIGFLGASIGMVLGLLIGFNISSFFALLESIVNGGIHLLNLIVSPFTGGVNLGEENFAIFSPAVFYIKEIPCRIIPHEALIIFLFGLLSAAVSSWLASGRVSRIRPAEVLRYE
ncbi:MAG: ABC transporter permease [Treponema sp.]|jgi:lipoprotein-releasing system permease protein|nr:ABC transporter permease [Treponema sp.]